jgi:hypothetical protein
MNYFNKILDLASKVNFTSLQQYFLSRGWNKVNTKRDDVVVIVSPDNNPKFDVLLPLSRNFADYNQAIVDAIRKLSDFEKRDELQIVNDLISPPSDIVRFRIENETTSSGLIPLRSGFELLESARKSLLSAASDIISPSLYHKRMSYKPAIQFIDACYLGQTERGSYIASIVCPFIKISEDDKATQLTLFSPQDVLQGSITRGITKKLMSSIFKVKKAIESANIDTLLTPEGNDLISANFLESIVEINEYTQTSKMEITTTWAPTIPIPGDVPASIEITSDYIDPIKSIIDRISPDIIETAGEYVGKISQIKANPDIKNREDGEISFIFINEDEKAINAKVILQGSNLNDAIRAFENGKNVKISGNLKILARQKVIEQPTFQVIE